MIGILASIVEWNSLATENTLVAKQAGMRIIHSAMMDFQSKGWQILQLNNSDLRNKNILKLDADHFVAIVSSSASNKIKYSNYNDSLLINKMIYEVGRQGLQITSIDLHQLKELRNFLELQSYKLEAMLAVNYSSNFRQHNAV